MYDRFEFYVIRIYILLHFMAISAYIKCIIKYILEIILIYIIYIF